MNDSIIPEDFIDSLNDEQDLIDESIIAEPEVEEELSDPLISEGEEGDDNAPGWLEDIEAEEGEGGSSMEEAEIDSLGDLAVDAIHSAKDFLEKYFSSKLSEALKKRFSPEEYKYLALVRFQEQSGKKMDMQTLQSVLKQAAELDPSYKDVKFTTVLDIAVEYREIKALYSPSEFKQYQQEGIRRYTRLTVRKHFGNKRPDPVAMLVLYIAISMGMDVVRLWNAIQEE